MYKNDLNKPIEYEIINLTCKYCGKSGFNDKKGLATHRKYSKECFLKWKREQEENESKKTKVKCEICGKLLRNISNTHLNTHNLTQQEYKIKFPNAKLFSDGLLEAQKEKREKKLFEKYGNDNSWRSPSLENFIKRLGEEKGKQKYDEYCKKLKENAPSLENFIKRLGEEEGKRKYDEYCKKLKGQKTLQYYIEKYGEEKGKQKYDEYCKIISNCHKKEWYLNKFGLEEGIKIFNEINKKKSVTLENFILKYGEEEGKRKYKEIFDNQLKHQSKIALELFNKIKETFKDEKVYFYNNPKEYGRYLKSIKKYCFLDFYMPSKNKVIEFYRGLLARKS